MKVIINAIDKATKAGVYGLEEVLVVAKQIEQLGEIVQKYNSSQESVKTPSSLEKSTTKKDPIDKSK